MRSETIKTSNVERFLAAQAKIQKRSVPEACIMLVSGEPGLGKSAVGTWWQAEHQGVFIRLTAATTPHWVLTDLVRELGQQTPAHRCEDLFAQAVGVLSSQRKLVIVDEVENGLGGNIKVLETLRDVTDMTLCPMVFLGREHVYGHLKKHRHFTGRIGAHAEFQRATRDDVKLLCDGLAEVPIGDDAVDHIHRDSEGYIREVLKRIEEAERVGFKSGRTVTAGDFGKAA